MASFVITNAQLDFIDGLVAKAPGARIHDLYVQVTREYPARGWLPSQHEVEYNDDGFRVRFDRPGNWHHVRIDISHEGLPSLDVELVKTPVASPAQIAGMLKERSILFLGCARQCAGAIESTLRTFARLGAAFRRYAILVFENDSTDGTRRVLQELEKELPLELMFADGLDAILPVRTQRLACIRNRLIDRARASDYDYICWADMDGVVREDNPSIESFQSCFKLESCWDGVFPLNQGPYYDIWAFRQAQVSPADYNLRMNQVDAAFGKPLAFHFGLTHLQVDMRSMAGWLPVDSAFGGMAIYKRRSLAGARYLGLMDGVEDVEHVAFNRALRANARQLYINPEFQVATHG